MQLIHQLLVLLALLLELELPIVLHLMTAERKGREEGEILKLISLVQKKCLRGKALEVVSEELEEDPENIREIYKAASEHLENSPEDILEILKRG